ncbi:nucleotide-binding universal stress UspA family protein [Actinoplanes octamycinicus]|uniref:Nucleotide-binding universal stress UspA family protein n=1 Tax=Actinoplanes octamycinicus TaxID=135948 RepID=A0A7W7H2K1_9ACTN|nr:universal stress protein [Actinoplanes octamycinicus]MBB4742826.1 nucleotide-binding universal stress UspA family protein [Actinoplanes octamycinicus]GIE58320.1 universal stress protein [Actinoplanes octamycinicus]
MSDLGKYRVEQEARQRAGTSRRATRYGEVINRYLGTYSYVDPYVPAKAPAPDPPVIDSTATGTVIAGVDDAPTSHVAVDHAAIEAELRGYGLLLVHAGNTPHDPRLLTRVVKRVRAFAPSVPVTTRVSVGMTPVEMLLTDAGDDDLIVVGHRHGPLRGALRRSVADRVAARHPGPVLVVDAPWPAAPELASRPLVVGVDEAPSAGRVVGFALQEARLRGCDLILLHVTREASDAPDRSDRRGGVTVQNRTVVGNPVNELVSASQYAAAVVLGRRPGHIGLGSVGGAVLHQAQCPIFFVG